MVINPLNFSSVPALLKILTVCL